MNANAKLVIAVTAITTLSFLLTAAVLVLLFISSAKAQMMDVNLYPLYAHEEGDIRISQAPRNQQQQLAGLGLSRNNTITDAQDAANDQLVATHNIFFPAIQTANAVNNLVGGVVASPATAGAVFQIASQISQVSGNVSDQNVQDAVGIVASTQGYSNAFYDALAHPRVQAGDISFLAGTLPDEEFDTLHALRDTLPQSMYTGMLSLVVGTQSTTNAVYTALENPATVTAITGGIHTFSTLAGSVTLSDIQSVLDVAFGLQQDVGDVLNQISTPHGFADFLLSLPSSSLPPNIQNQINNYKDLVSAYNMLMEAPVEIRVKETILSQIEVTTELTGFRELTTLSFSFRPSAPQGKRFKAAFGMFGLDKEEELETGETEYRASVRPMVTAGIVKAKFEGNSYNARGQYVATEQTVTATIPYGEVGLALGFAAEKALTKNSAVTFQAGGYVKDVVSVVGYNVDTNPQDWGVTARVTLKF